VWTRVCGVWPCGVWPWSVYEFELPVSGFFVVLMSSLLSSLPKVPCRPLH
jgi:hypothetical protein